MIFKGVGGSEFFLVNLQIWNVFRVRVAIYNFTCFRKSLRAAPPAPPGPGRGSRGAGNRAPVEFPGPDHLR